MSVSEENIQKSKQAKEKGNVCFKNQDYPSALNLYNLGLDYNPYDVALYTNRALIFIKELKYDKAIDDCNKALKLDKEYIRVYERRAQAYFGLKDYSRAIKDLITALELEPNLNQARELLEQCYVLRINEKKTQNPVVMTSLPPLEDEPELDEELLLYDSIELIEKAINSSLKMQENAKKFRKQGKYKSSVEESLKGLSLLNQLIAKKTEKVENIKLNLVKLIAKFYASLLEFDQALLTIKNAFKLQFSNEKSLNALHKCKSHIYQIQGQYQKALDEILLLKKFGNDERLKISMLKYLINPQSEAIKNLDLKKLNILLDKWKKEKDDANQLFKKNKCFDAISIIDSIHYDISKRYDEVEILSCKDLKDFILILHNNKAIIFASLGKYHLSFKECFEVFAYDIENLKAWFRFGKNLSELEEFYMARKCFEKIVCIEPKNDDFVKELKKIEEKIRRIEYQEMGPIEILLEEKIKVLEVSEEPNENEARRVLPLEVEIKFEESISNENTMKKEDLIQNIGLFIENPEILIEENKITENFEVKNSTNQKSLHKDPEINKETPEKPKTQSKNLKSLINAAISYTKLKSPVRPVPKTFLEFSFSLKSIIQEKQELIPYLKSIPIENHKNIFENKDHSIEELEFLITELFSFENVQDEWFISLINSMSTVSGLNIKLKMLNTELRYYLNAILERISDESLKTKFMLKKKHI